MTFRIRQIETTAGGREIVRERVVDKPSITIGRAAENDVQVPDLAVEQHHVRVTAGEDGSLAFEATGTLGFTLDGRTRQSETKADGGGELVLGAYRLDFASAADREITITIRRREQRDSARAEALHGFTLASALPGKRATAWVLLAAVVALFLAIPLWSYLSREPAKPDPARPGSVMMDASWSSGPLSTAHAGLQDNCEACHVKAFTAVRDSTCLTCHQKIGDHAQRPRLTLARGPMSWGDKIQSDIADMFGKPAAGACTDCHTEHEGEGRMKPPAQAFCADCHESLDRRLANTPLGNAADFGTVHPGFQVAVLTQAGQAKPQRLALSQRPKEFNGLKFPHDLHLRTGGGVARMAARLGGRYEGALECSDCHRPSTDQVRFQPVQMERDCGACHSLVYDRSGGDFRTLPHGNIGAMRAALSRGDRAPRRPIASGRRRPGEYAPGGIYYGNFAPPQRASVPLASRMLSVGGACSECHYPGGSGVLPVTQPKRYIAHGWFDHRDHNKEKCTTCHVASQSGAASDVLLPDIKTCRTCHLGEDASKPKIASGCAMCHSYHPRGGMPGRQAIGRTKVALTEPPPGDTR